MTTADTADRTYSLLPSRVRECLDVLLERDTHPHFVAYLYLRFLAGKSGSLHGLQPNWADLGKVLEVPGGPAGRPYLRPFWRGERNAGQEWLNENLAGSFAPSSLRVVLGRVVQTDAQRRYSLRPRHWDLAKEHLLFDTPIPAAAVAGFLFRDYGFVAESPPSPADLIDVFRREYGYSQEDEVEFNALYDVSWTGQDGKWFELLQGEEDG